MISGADIRESSLATLGELNPLQTFGAEGNNAMPMHHLIARYAEESMNEILSIVPERYLKYSEIPGEIVKNQDGSGYIPLPDDFTRRIRFQMKGWRRAVTTAVYEDDVIYRQQQSPATRGGICRPVCAIVKGEKGFRLESYTLPPYILNPEALVKQYVKRVRSSSDPKIFQEEEFDIDDRLLPIIALQISKRVALSLNETDMSSVYENEVMKAIALL